jgi:hypothetical protein
VEKFKIKPWPEDRMGVFYNGDSYIVLHVSQCLIHFSTGQVLVVNVAFESC